MLNFNPLNLCNNSNITSSQFHRNETMISCLKLKKKESSFQVPQRLEFITKLLLYNLQKSDWLVTLLIIQIISLFFYCLISSKYLHKTEKQTDFIILYLTFCYCFIDSQNQFRFLLCDFSLSQFNFRISFFPAAILSLLRHVEG